MQFLQQFIEDHYIGTERTSLVKLLKKYELYPILDQILSVHKSGLTFHNSLPAEQAMTIASSYASMALTAINLKIGSINHQEERTIIKKAIAQMGLRLYLSFIRQFPEEMIEITAQMKNSLPEICAAMGYDYNEFKEHVNVEQLEIVIREISGMSSVNVKLLPRPKQQRIQWREKGQLAYLTHELKIRNWIRKKNEWMNFLDANKTPGIVHWNEKHKAELAYLLYSLYQNDFISPTGTKGYFTIAEEFLRDYSGRRFTKKALKKLSSKITCDMEKYQEITNVVNKILQKIQRKTGDD